MNGFFLLAPSLSTSTAKKRDNKNTAETEINTRCKPIRKLTAKLVNTPIEKSKDILKEFENGLQIRLGKYGKPPYLLAFRGTEIGNVFKEKRKKPFVGIPKDILEKYKNNIQSISYKEVEEIIDNFLKK